LDDWLEELRSESSDAIAPDSIESAERQLDTFKQQRLSSLDACLDTIAQGEALLQELRSVGLNADTDTTGSVTAVESALDRLRKQRDELEELWTAKKLRSDLCLRLRLFERDALQLSSQLEMWISELDQTRLPESLEEAEIALRAHTDSVQHMTSTTYQVLQAGQDLASVLESSGVNVMADAQYSAGSRVSVLLEFLNEREMDLEDLAEVKRVKLEQCVQLCQYRVDANQISIGDAAGHTERKRRQTGAEHRPELGSEFGLKSQRNYQRIERAERGEAAICSSKRVHNGRAAANRANVRQGLGNLHTRLSGRDARRQRRTCERSRKRAHHLRQHRADTRLPSRRVSQGAGKVRDDARRCGPLLRHLGEYGASNFIGSYST
ncbi:unnamed protein product, partial [Nesidiocoris tenuis]